MATPLIVPPQPLLRGSLRRPFDYRRPLPSLFSATITHWVFSGRYAIYHGLRAVGVAPGHTVLVPSYHCASMVEPVLRIGAKVAFYRVHRDCSPDFDDIEARIDQSTRAVISIHYFGFPQPIHRFRSLCDDHGLYLLEDCAHVLSADVDGVALGSVGDISVFSWRKLVPVYDSGQLVINNPRLSVDIPWEKETVLLKLKILVNLLDRVIDDSSRGAARHLAPLRRLPSWLGRSVAAKLSRGSQALAVRNYGADFDAAMVNLRMSSLSRYVLSHLDLPSIVERRRSNYLFLSRAVRVLPGVIPFFPNLPDGICPLALPLLIEGREDFHLALRARGIPASTWGDVVHPHFSPVDFPEAAALYHRLIFLPIHQSLDTEHLEIIRAAMEDAVRHDA